MDKEIIGFFGKNKKQVKFFPKYFLPSFSKYDILDLRVSFRTEYNLLCRVKPWKIYKVGILLGFSGRDSDQINKYLKLLQGNPRDIKEEEKRGMLEILEVYCQKLIEYRKDHPRVPEPIEQLLDVKRYLKDEVRECVRAGGAHRYSTWLPWDTNIIHVVADCTFEKFLQLLPDYMSNRDFWDFSQGKIPCGGGEE